MHLLTPTTYIVRKKVIGLDFCRW